MPPPLITAGRHPAATIQVNTTQTKPKFPKRQQELLDFLGPEYSIKRIDIGDVIYRKINDSYDVEIDVSGRRAACVFVWDISGRTGITARVAERHLAVAGRDDVKALLDGIVKKYGGDGG